MAPVSSKDLAAAVVGPLSTPSRCKQTCDCTVQCRRNAHKNAAQLVQHPVAGRIQPLQVLLWPASHAGRKGCMPASCTKRVKQHILRVWQLKRGAAVHHQITQNGCWAGRALHHGCSMLLTLIALSLLCLTWREYQSASLSHAHRLQLSSRSASSLSLPAVT